MRFVFLFFFSSRRRHTRSLCDWSSDVCSSDLIGARRRVCFSRCSVLRDVRGISRLTVPWCGAVNHLALDPSRDSARNLCEKCGAALAAVTSEVFSGGQQPCFLTTRTRRTSRLPPQPHRATAKPAHLRKLLRL